MNQNPDKSKLTSDDVRAILKKHQTTGANALAETGYRAALTSLLTCIDNFKGIDLVEVRANNLAKIEKLVLLQGLEALHLIGLWTQNCLPNGKPLSIEAAKKILDQAEESMVVTDLLVMVIGGWADAFELKDGTLEISVTEFIDYRLEAANRLLSQSQTSATPKIDKFPSAFAELSNKLGKSKGRKMRIPSKEFDRLAIRIEKYIMTWQFPKEWTLGNYTFADFRRFWSVLMTIIFVHLYQLQNQSLKPVKINLKNAWIDEISRRSNLNKITVKSILQDLTYSPALYSPPAEGQKKKIPYVLAQPFFAIDDKYLAVTSAAILFTNIEEIFFDLFSIIKSDLYFELTNKKELLWKEDLARIVADHGIECYGPFSVNFNSHPTDLDLLLVDHADKFAIACELKWLKSHNQLRDCTSNDIELKKGCGQAQLCVDWLRFDPSVLNTLVNGCYDWSSYAFEGLVLSKNSLGASKVQDPNIPILNKFLVETFLNHPSSKTLRQLWSTARSKNYLPKEGLHFHLDDLVCNMEQRKIIGKNINFIPDKPWDPTHDLSTHSKQ